MTRRLVVESELAGAVAGHADAHQSQEEGSAGHHRTVPWLEHGLRCLSLEVSDVSRGQARKDAEKHCVCLSKVPYSWDKTAAKRPFGHSTRQRPLLLSGSSAPAFGS